MAQFLRSRLFELRAGRGQDEQKRRTVIQFAFRADRSSVGEHDVLRNGEAKAGASRLAGAGLINAVEALEQARHVLG